MAGAFKLPPTIVGMTVGVALQSFASNLAVGKLGPAAASSVCARLAMGEKAGKSLELPGDRRPA
jgi:hypothetical protein